MNPRCGFFGASALFCEFARAQHCEPPAPPDGALLRTSLRAEAARFTSGSLDGFYEGIGVGIEAHSDTVGARANLPYYRLLDANGPANGFGDAFARVEAGVRPAETWSLGPSLSVSLPTGSPSERLGMGHAMLGASAWIAWRAPELFIAGELGYAQAVAERDDASPATKAETHQHGAQTHEPATSGSIPNPMNPEELWLGLSSRYDVLSWMSVSLGGIVAFPTSEEGTLRATLNGGTEFPLGAFHTGVGIEVDLFGTTRREVVLASAGMEF